MLFHRIQMEINNLLSSEQLIHIEDKAPVAEISIIMGDEASDCEKVSRSVSTSSQRI